MKKKDIKSISAITQRHERIYRKAKERSLPLVSHLLPLISQTRALSLPGDKKEDNRRRNLGRLMDRKKEEKRTPYKEKQENVREEKRKGQSLCICNGRTKSPLRSREGPPGVYTPYEDGKRSLPDLGYILLLLHSRPLLLVHHDHHHLLLLSECANFFLVLAFSCPIESLVLLLDTLSSFSVVHVGSR